MLSDTNWIGSLSLSLSQLISLWKRNAQLRQWYKIPVIKWKNVFFLFYIPTYLIRIFKMKFCYFQAVELFMEFSQLFKPNRLLWFFIHLPFLILLIWESIRKITLIVLLFSIHTRMNFVLLYSHLKTNKVYFGQFSHIWTNCLWNCCLKHKSIVFGFEWVSSR